MLESKDVEKVDAHRMRDIIASFPDQLEESRRRASSVHADLGKAERIFIVGMGGSGIAGEVFAAWAADRSRLPIQPIHDYRLPTYARPGDALVVVSYSGNTEETLAAAAQGIKLGCRLVAVTSGGALAALARNAGAAVFEVPSGLPPRGAFGHLFGILAEVGAEWVTGDMDDELDQATTHLRAIRARLAPAVPVTRNRAKRLAVRMKGSTPIVYGAPPFNAIAKRWQTQLNENAKVVAFASSLPEADHNEIVGWTSDPAAARFTALILRDRAETPEMRRRLDVTAAMFRRRARVEQVHDNEGQLLGRMLGTLYLGDYVSLYLAVLRRVDPIPLPSIVELKDRLARAPTPRS